MSKKGQKDNIGLVLSNQFASSWKMLRQAIKNVPDTYWSKEINDWSFSWNIYHIIETADYYKQSTPTGMEWGKRVNINLKADSENTIKQKKAKITKDQLLGYLEEIEDQVSDLLENSSDEELLGKDEFDDGHLIILEKILYLLRHNMHHIGELNKALRDWQCERIKWQ
ncbi:MAG: DinB family protein [Promethearchaeota archaeon]